MESYGYEIKHGRHIDFRGKEQQKFAIVKTMGVNYTGKRIKFRILNIEKKLAISLILRTTKKLSQAKDISDGLRNII